MNEHEEKFGCGHCGCNEGKFHKEFSINGCCDMEICPLCKEQLLLCNCDKFKIVKNNIREPYFENNLISSKLIEFNCARCGKEPSPMEIISNKKWKFICGATYPLNCIICDKCKDFILNKRKKLKKREKKDG